MISVAVMGAHGRMGQSVLAGLHADPNFELVAALVREGSEHAGQAVGTHAPTQRYVTEVNQALQQADVVIDFTAPESTLATAELAALHQVPMVIGTTGFDAAQLAQLQAYAQTLPMVVAPNMSIGVNLMWHLVAQAAAVMGAESDIEISETHHRDKKDSPSGTALKLGSVIAETLGWPLDEVACMGRDGINGARPQRQIGFHALRGGDVIGDHTVLFAADGERFEVTHKASSREIYVKGALKAAAWLQNKPLGWYDMKDVLGFKENALS